jgi:hypothetical protein
LKEFFSEWDEKEQIYDNRIFRKLKLNTYYNTLKSENKFRKKFKDTFGKDTTVIMGDWSVSSMKYHTPTKTKGFRRMFKENGFNIFLCDEYLTSKICPKCETKSLETFKTRLSSRPWRKGVWKKFMDCYVAKTNIVNKK